MKKIQPIYFALDFENAETALSFLDKNDLSGIPVKVGMELYYREGPRIIEQLKSRGHDIFLDLKLHDIPETVRRSMRNLAKLDVDVINVHAQGGGDMIKAAKRGLEEGASDEVPVLLAVTMLTSTDQKMLEQDLLLKESLINVVHHYSKLAEINGADGVVCSVEEAAMIKQQTRLLALTPGIREKNGGRQDQKRVATPVEALEKGSDSIVVGRAIRDAEDPQATYTKMKEAFTYGQQTTHS
ncbi:orotidine-5'-phosphate decarboxylase [Halobacillus dabanensis]|uniref:Orotidine 5'-phosphate decarboxylase n=1 Tax=Halobacillus dabanensis TaxID=240302 RepID=A0A1I3VID9_HALDA|nr:orotidine-5'-phosphate decarboxylase [Halobacillus dabanensis]SFJ94017.1 orotidine-5'-phosphate decarboxylase [Halobacillus dabanensis]